MNKTIEELTKEREQLKEEGNRILEDTEAILKKTRCYSNSSPTSESPEYKATRENINLLAQSIQDDEKTIENLIENNYSTNGTIPAFIGELKSCVLEKRRILHQQYRLINLILERDLEKLYQEEEKLSQSTEKLIKKAKKAIKDI